MTDEDREKFDAIRMNLELTSHDLEDLKIVSAHQAESFRELGAAVKMLLAVSDRHETRITRLEGQR